jgi:hypothetical protein
MPSAFGVSNSPITSSGDIGVTALGLSSQYIRGDGQLANFPTSFGGGSSVNYYFNGGTSQGSFGGTTYYEMGTTADTGSAVDFTLDSTTPSIGFITDVGVPDQILVPNGSWVLRTYFSQSNNTGQCTVQGFLYKYDGATFTLISTGTAESITNGTTADLYTYSIPIPSGTTLTTTDRLAIVITAGNFGGGRTVTLYTKDSKLAQVQTTYSTGLTALNGLTDQVQYFQVGTSGTSFDISSSGDTHTFNLPTASATNSGALSNTDWTTFNSKGNGDLKADGTIPLTANWNVGAYEITANTFIGNNGFSFNVGLGGSLVSASTTGSAKTWTLPNTAGTIALTSDIPSVSGYLKADGTIPLTADWNVGAFGVTANTFTANNGFTFNIGLGGSLVSASTTSTAKTWTLPNTTGTIALTSDIPSLSGYLKADGTIPLTANWNVGAYEITANKFIGNNGFGFNVGLGGTLVSASTTTSAKTWTLPNITGTIALLNSPVFTGTPTVPSPSLSDNSAQIPNTAWINVKGFSRWFGIYNASTNTFTSPNESALPTTYNYGDTFTVSVAGVGNPVYGGSYYNVGDVWTYGKVGEDDKFLLATSIQTGTLSAYSSTTGTIATTDSVVSAISKLNGNIGLKANIDSPAFTGTPTAPTPTIGDDSTKIATTEFVQDAIATSSTPYGTIFSQATFNFLT